jgi:hypothetical protein
MHEIKQRGTAKISMIKPALGLYSSVSREIWMLGDWLALSGFRVDIAAIRSGLSWPKAKCSYKRMKIS